MVHVSDGETENLVLSHLKRLIEEYYRSDRHYYCHQDEHTCQPNVVSCRKILSYCRDRGHKFTYKTVTKPQQNVSARRPSYQSSRQISCHQ